jgi:hypothetical protein
MILKGKHAKRMERDAKRIRKDANRLEEIRKLKESGQSIELSDSLFIQVNAIKNAYSLSISQIIRLALMIFVRYVDAQFSGAQMFIVHKDGRSQRIDLSAPNEEDPLPVMLPPIEEMYPSSKNTFAPKKTFRGKGGRIEVGDIRDIRPIFGMHIDSADAITGSGHPQPQGIIQAVSEPADPPF